MVPLELEVKKLISDILGGSNNSLVLKNRECERTDTLIETGKYHVKEVGTKTENGSDHVNILMKGSGIVIIGRIGTTETGIGTGTETETGKEIEIVGVIEIEHGTVIVSEGGTVIGIENMIDIVRGIEIMKLVTLIEDAHVIGSLIMIVLNLNMGKGIMTMNLRMIVVGITSMNMDVGMQTLIMTLSGMTTTIMEMTMVTITISIVTMMGWKMTTMLDVQHLNRMKRREVMMWTVNINAQRDHIPGSMIIRTWA